MLKAFLQGNEPLQWKGGCTSFPKSPAYFEQMLCEASCSSLVVGKSTMQMLIDWARSEKIPAQLGGFRFQQTCFATHLLRTYCGLADAQKLSFGVVVFDVRSAFHHMLREHTFGGESLAPRLCEVLLAAGFDVDSLQADTEQHSNSFGQHPNQCLHRAVQDAHACTWYVVDGLDECHQTHGGSRPGSPLADIASNITMTSVLRAVLPELWRHPGLCAAAACMPAFPPLITWVDDLAIPVPSLSAAGLDDSLVFVLETVSRAMTSHALQLNLQAGKTEIVCQYHGPGALECRHRRFLEFAGHLPLSDGQRLRVVAQYQHLGMAFHQSLSFFSTRNSRPHW